VSVGREVSGEWERELLKMTSGTDFEDLAAGDLHRRRRRHRRLGQMAREVGQRSGPGRIRTVSTPSPVKLSRSTLCAMGSR